MKYPSPYFIALAKGSGVILFSSTMSHSYRPANSHSFGLRLKQMPNLKSGFRVRKSEKIAPILTSFTCYHGKNCPIFEYHSIAPSEVCKSAQLASLQTVLQPPKTFQSSLEIPLTLFHCLTFIASICLGTLSSGTIYNDSGQWNTPPPISSRSNRILLLLDFIAQAQGSGVILTFSTMSHS